MTTTQYAIRSATPASRRFTVVALLALAGLATVPMWSSNGLMVSLTELLILVVIGQLWNLLAGYAGIYSFGQQAYIGIGGYTMLVVADQLDLDIWVGLVLAIVVSGLIAIPSAWLLFRLRGGYFAVGTWVLAETYRLIVKNNETLYPSGTPQPLRSLAGLGESRFAITFWLSFALAVGVILGVYFLMRSRTGLALRAIRDNEMAASTAGVAVRRTQIMLYLAVGAVTGLTGAVFLLKAVSISPDSFFSIDWTAQMLMIVMIGGLGTIEGPVVGAAVFFLLRENLADLGSLWFIILGVVLIVIMIRAPRGIWGLVRARTGVELLPVRKRLEMTTTPGGQS
ncbi:MAG TPA: branched-chain amino acid ABC transporter permease [Acidimicrobiia bacterium]